MFAEGNRSKERRDHYWAHIVIKVSDQFLGEMWVIANISRCIEEAFPEFKQVTPKNLADAHSRLHQRVPRCLVASRAPSRDSSKRKIAVALRRIIAGNASSQLVYAPGGGMVPSAPHTPLDPTATFDLLTRSTVGSVLFVGYLRGRVHLPPRI